MDVRELSNIYHDTANTIALKLSNKTARRIYWTLARPVWELTGVVCFSGSPRAKLDEAIKEFHDECVKTMRFIERQIKWFSWRLEKWEIPILWELWGYLSSIKDEKFPSKYDHLFG